MVKVNRLEMNTQDDKFEFKKHVFDPKRKLIIPLNRIELDTEKLKDIKISLDQQIKLRKWKLKNDISDIKSLKSKDFIGQTQFLAMQMNKLVQNNADEVIEEENDYHDNIHYLGPPIKCCVKVG